MILQETGEDAYFAASNSADGFYSYYHACFNDPRIGHVYAVKGGPGTGKSRFMREVAVHAEASGARVEYIYCSSDPESLDGVILTRGDKSIALLDATAPHVYEPRLPGVREELLNLGEFWDAEKLAARKDEVCAHGTEKSAAYRRAYRYLSGAGECLRMRDELVTQFVRREAITHLAERLMREIPMGEGYRAQITLMRSIGMKGEVELDGFYRNAQQLYLLRDCHGAASCLLDAIGRLAVERRQRVRISHDPLLPERMDGVAFPDCGVAFVTERTPILHQNAVSISMRRFVQTAQLRPGRASVTYAERMYRAMLAGALEELAAVRRAHFALESIYSDCMDFAKKEEYTRTFCKKMKL